MRSTVICKVNGNYVTILQLKNNWGYYQIKCGVLSDDGKIDVEEKAALFTWDLYEYGILYGKFIAHYPNMRSKVA